jgi:signal transduction histidine kinase
VVVGITAATWAIALFFEPAERLYLWTRRYEQIELDEALAAVVSLTAALVWYALRRYRAAQLAREGDQRATIQLSDALSEQRRLAQRYVELHEAERKALARELHDELGQYLNLIKLDAVQIRDAMSPTASAHAAAASLIERVDLAHRATAALLRRLRPVGLEELGLRAALEHLVETARAGLGATDIGLTLGADLDRLEDAMALTVYRLVQEGLTNCAKHAGATKIEVAVVGERTEEGQRLILTIADNGVGAEVGSPARGLGLVGMRERVIAHGGEMKVVTALGQGFAIRAVIPVLEHYGNR